MLKDIVVRAARAGRRALPAPMQQSARRLVRLIRRARFRRRIVTRSIFGRPLRIEFDDRIAEQWYDHDMPLLPSFAHLVNSDRWAGYDRVFYLGAHHCVYGLGLAAQMQPAGRMMAVEANSRHFRAAQRNLELNDCRNIEIVQAAVADADGTIAFTLGHSVANGDVGVPTETVRAATIDTLAKEHGAPDLVILDVEGYEAKALAGAAATLAGPTDWCIEVHAATGLERFGGSVEGIVQLFPQSDYELLMARDFGTGEVMALDMASSLVGGRFHLLALPRHGRAQATA